MSSSSRTDSSDIFFIFLVIGSFLIHILILSLFDWQIPKPEEEFFEVDLVALPPLQKTVPISPKKLKIPKSETIIPEPQPPEPRERIPRPSVGEVSLSAPPNTKFVDTTVKKSDFEKIRIKDGRLGNTQFEPIPYTDVVPHSSSERSSMIAPQFSDDTKLPQKGKQRYTSPEGFGGASEKTVPKIKTQVGLDDKIVRRRFTKKKVKVADSNGEDEGDQGKGIKRNWGNSKFSGEISYRKVIHRPDPPVVAVKQNITIAFRFTVLPSGEVNQVFPLIKGNSELEKVGRNHLRKYRFEPLTGSKQVQEGTVHFSLVQQK